MDSRQIARASHNILAFRLTTPSGNLLSDCDDDGPRPSHIYLSI